MTKRSLSILIFCMAIIFVGAGLAWYLYQTCEKKDALLNVTLLPKALPVNDFNLHDDQGKPFSTAQLKGHWNLLFFGFTHCAMLCPSTLTELNRLYQELENNKVVHMPRVVFISVDPERDTTQRIHTYLQSFNKNFVGATGEEKELTKLTKQLGIAYMKAPKSNEKDYQIDHSGSIIVVNPKGEWVAVLNTPHDSKIIANNIELLQQRS